jgi:carbon-monoxide dehydrogenase medium subunit
MERDGLDYISYSDSEGLRIGALTPIRDIESSSIIEQRFPILTQATHEAEAIGISDTATVGQSLSRAGASADMALSLIALGAGVKTEGPEGAGAAPMEDFFAVPGHAATLTEIQIPNVPAHAGVAYKRFPDTDDIPAIGVAVLVALDPKHVLILGARIVLGGIAPTPLRARRAEDIIRGQPIGEGVIQRVAQAAAEEATLPSDAPSATHQREVIRKLTDQAIGDAIYLTQPDFLSGG